MTLVGIQLVHAGLRRTEVVEFRPARLKAAAPGFFVWLASSAVGIALLQMGGFAPVLSSLAPLIALAVAVVAYAIVLLCGGTALKDPAPEYVKAAVDDVWLARVACDACDRSYTAQEMDLGRAGGRVLCLECQDVGTTGVSSTPVSA